MKSIRVTAVQMNGLLGQTERTLEEIESWSGRAAEQGAELVLFPELAIQGALDGPRMLVSRRSHRMVQVLNGWSSSHGNGSWCYVLACQKRKGISSTTARC